MNGSEESIGKAAEADDVFRSCIRASTAALLLATPSGAILEASLGASELFGYAPGELLSVTRDELILPDEAMTRALHERDNSGTVLAEVTGLRKDGAQFPVRWQSSRFTAPGGEPLISVAFTDLSDQKRIEHNARLLDYNLQLVLDNSDEGLVLMDTQYRFITFNKAAETAFRLLHGASLHTGENIFSLLGPADVVQLQTLFRSVLAGKQHEVRRKHNLPDGSIRVFLTIMRPLFKEGVVIGIILNSKDITRKFQAQEALRLSNERFERAAAASYDIIWEHDLLADRLTLTENFSRLLGYKGSPEMASEEYIKRVVHPDDRALVRSIGLAFVEGRDTHLHYPVHRLLKKDGGFIYAEANAVASRDEAGKAYRITGVTRDITKQHLMERELRESNRRYELAARASFDLVYEVDLETGAVVYNDVITSFYGYGPGELNSVQNNGKLIHPEDRVLLRQALEAAEAGRNNLLQMPLLRLLKKDGTLVYTELISLIVRNEDGRPVKRIGSARDISWRHAMEQELRKSKERFELAANASYDLIWERDFISESFYYNETFTTFYGYSARELQDPDAVFANFPHPDDRDWLATLVSEFLQGSDTHLSYPVHRLLKADGSVVYVEANALLLRGEDGAPLRMIGVSKDITGRHLMEQQLRESNDRFQRASEASYDVIWEADLRTGSLYFNELFYLLFGYGPGDVTGINDFFGTLLHPDDRDIIRFAAHQFVHSSDTFTRFPVHRVQRKDGSYMYAEARVRVSREADGHPYRMTGVTHDVTAQRLNEIEMRELNKQLKLRAAELEASNRELERFAYVASHDLQEPLRMVSSFMGLLTKRYAAQLDDTARQYIHFAVDGAERMKRLILDLLEFSRIGTNASARGLVDLDRLLAELRQEFVFSIEEKGARVEITPLPVVWGHESQLRQLWQNLLGNALKYNRSETPSIHIGYTEDEGSYTFFIRDNGIGIDPRYFEKIFVIFQQLHTHSEYPGTGIGLAVAKKIVDQHGGRIWLDSSPGAGSTFYFTLPKTPKTS